METDRKFLAMMFGNRANREQPLSHSRPTCTSPAEGVMERNSSLQLTHGISIRGPNFIECLRSCFNNSNNVLMGFMLETKQQKVYIYPFSITSNYLNYIFSLKVSKYNWAMEPVDRLT